jgi:hypothetical protein
VDFVMNARNFFMWVVSGMLLAGCGSEKKKEEAKDVKETASEKAAPETESRVKHGTNGEVIITVEAKLQQTIGLQTAGLEAAQLSPELKAYGRVLDPSGLASLVAEFVTADAASQASQAEFKRLKILAEQSNASERAVQTAQAAAVHDQAQLQSVRLRLLAGWGSAISQRSDLPDLVAALGSQSSALVQVQIPAGYSLPGMPKNARLFALGDETKSITAELLGSAPAVDAQMQGRGFLLLVTPNPAGLVPGAAVTAYLNFPGEPRTGVLLPRSAVVRFNAGTWIYLQTSDNTFQRQIVVLEAPLEKGWFVAAGLTPQDKVVVTGAQQLLSEELKGQGGAD